MGRPARRAEFLEIGPERYSFAHVDETLGTWAALQTNKAYRRGMREASKVLIRGGRQRLRDRLLRNGKSTGALLSSFAFRIKRRKPEAIVGFGTLGRHAHLVDRGTEVRETGKGYSRGKMPANYFWSATKEQDGKEAIEAMKRGIINTLMNERI